MPIKPKYSIGETRPLATRQFTDREELIRAFLSAVQDDKQKEQRVLMFYGVGGIGKTSLRKELVKLFETTKTNNVLAVLDFEVPSFREQETALFALRKSLKDKYKIKFPTFDLAYAIYWKKTRPQIPMNKENFPLLEDGELIGEIVAALGDVPVIGAVPKISRVILKGEKLLKDWWTRRGHKELYNLPQMEPKDIAERLPMYWAADLKDYLQTKTLPAVLFIDSYEALWEGARSEAKVLTQDEWIRELVSQLPEVLWVICGRERLRWEESDADWSKYLKQHPVGGLADEDAKRFLLSCGITAESIQNVIVEGSKGVPYYLDLAVDTYYEIKNRLNREPVAVDFAKTPQEVFIRFLRYLDKSEIETLKVLSVPRFWNYPLFEHLATEFKTGYPITAFAELCRFSFINQGEVTDTWTMHQLMRESLKEHLESNILKSVHQFLFNHYSAELKDLDIKQITDQHKNALNEAFYHGKFYLEAAAFFNWFIKASYIFDLAAQLKLLVPLYEEITSLLIKALGNNHSSVASAMNNLALLYNRQGKYNDAEILYKQALAIYKETFGQNHPSVAFALFNLGNLNQARVKYNEAEILLKQALAIREKTLGPDHPQTADSLNCLGLLYVEQGKYGDAEPLYKRALQIKGKTPGKEQQDITYILNNLGLLYFDQGKYPEAELFYQRTLEIKEKTLGKNHPSLGKTLNNLGLLYFNQRKYEEAERFYKRALAIKEKTLGPDHPDVAVSLNNLAELYRCQSRYKEVEPLCRQALKITEEVFSKDHIYAADSLNNLAQLHHATGQYQKAESFYQQALAILEKVLGQNHPEVAVSLNNLANLYREQDKFSEAKPLYKRALTIREKALSPDHPYTVSLLEDMVKFYKRMGKNEEANIFEERVKRIQPKIKRPDSA